MVDADPELHGITAMIPNIGDEAPDFFVVDSAGAGRSLDSLVADGRCVLIFYRGHW